MESIVNVTGGVLDDRERDAYLERAAKLYGRKPDIMDVRLDGDFVDLSYHYKARPFHRIRRITGYLVGTLDRFNDAKRAEERERVKHTLSL